MAILKIRNDKGEFVEVSTIMGPKGDSGDFADFDERLYDQTVDSQYDTYTCNYINHELLPIMSIVGKIDDIQQLPIVVAPGTASEYPEGTVRDDIKINSCYLVGEHNLIYILNENYEWEEIAIQSDMSGYLTQLDKEGLLARSEYVDTIIKTPTFTQINTLMDEKLWNTRDTRLLKYIGHFSDKNSLPFAGQKSASVTVSYPVTLTNDLRNSNFDITKIRAIVSEPYFIGTYTSNTDYTLIGFHNKEDLTLLKFVAWKSDSNQVTAAPLFGIRFSASDANPVKVYSYRTSSSAFNNGNRTYCAYRLMDDNTKEQRATPRSFTEEVEIYLEDIPNLCSNMTNHIFRYTQDSRGFCRIYGSSYQPNSSNHAPTKQAVLQFANNFAYTYDMAMLKFDNNCQPVWLTTEGEAEINDLVSYGNYMDYCRFNGEQWINFGTPSSEVFEYMNNALEGLRNEFSPDEPAVEETTE